MNDFEFTCTQKQTMYQDGWNHPQAISDATDENGNVIHCCEDDCSADCCLEEEPDDSIPPVEDESRLVCTIYEKTCTTEESRGPDNINDETGYRKHCSTSIRIVKKYLPHTQ